MSTAQFAGTGYVNGVEVPWCELRIDHEAEVIWSSGPRPDPGWIFTDGARHFHAYDDADEHSHYPTLKTRVVEHPPCDGSCMLGDTCEGYTETKYSCRICSEEIAPGLIHGEYPFNVPGRKSWRAIVPTATTPPISDRVSFRFETSAGQTFFGVGYATSVTVTPTGGRFEIAGEGPLGRSQARVKAAKAVTA